MVYKHIDKASNVQPKYRLDKMSIIEALTQNNLKIIAL